MIIPVRDHNPTRRIPYITYGILGLNILIFLSYVPALGNDLRLAAIFSDWAMVPAHVAEGTDSYTLLSSMFLHAGLLHLAGNMLFLWIFGDNLENAFGHVGFTLFYLATGLAAAGLHILTDPGSPVPTVGASGAISGVLGGYLLLYPKARVDVVFFFIPFVWMRSFAAWIVLSLWFAVQLGGSVLTSSAQGGVAYWAHIGGFVAGVILCLPWWLKQGGPQFWDRLRGTPPFEPTPVHNHLTRVPIVRRKR